MKTVILNVLFMIIVVVTGSWLASEYDPAPNAKPYKPTKSESTCHVQMCESLGGHDAIALQVMFGD